MSAKQGQRLPGLTTAWRTSAYFLQIKGCGMVQWFQCSRFDWTPQGPTHQDVTMSNQPSLYKCHLRKILRGRNPQTFQSLSFRLVKWGQDNRHTRTPSKHIDPMITKSGILATIRIAILLAIAPCATKSYCVMIVVDQ